MATHRHNWLFTRLNPLHQLILCSAALFPPLAFDCPALPPTCCIEDHSHRDVEDGEAKLCCRHDVAFPHMILYPTMVGSNGAAAARAEQCFSLTAMKTTRHRTRFLWALWELAAGITAGSWYAWPSTHVGYELIGAVMLILAGGGRGFPLDYDELERRTRIGYERRMRSRKGER